MKISSTVSSFSLAEVTVRLVTSNEVARWQTLMARHHYLGFPGFVGERLYQVAEWQGQWLALIGWTAAAYRCRAREVWIGWTPEQRRRRLRFVANNARFLILPDAHHPNLGSRVLALATRRLSADWQAIHGHPVVLAETFIDPSRFRGTVYRAANWQDAWVWTTSWDLSVAWPGKTGRCAALNSAGPSVAHGGVGRSSLYPWRGFRDVIHQILSDWPPKSHGSLSDPAGCSQAARRTPCLCHHPHHRLG
ncbi:MAG: DUF4338 domain-containing protein, partial [Firmicutes bacterium]|nr:DUF4338 domain-containing protein [Bacillota bacterium]